MLNIECLNLIITENCNFRCGYCYEKFSDCEEMSLEVIEQSIKFGLDNNTSNKFNVWLFGGEPLIRTDKLIHTINYAVELNKKYDKELTFDIFTNGSIYDPEFVKFLKDKNVRIQVSFDGVDGGQSERVTKIGEDTEQLVLSNLKKYIEALGNIRVHTRASISPEVAKKKILCKTMSVLKSIGVRQTAFNPVQELYWDEESIKCLDEDLEELEKSYEGFYKDMIVGNFISKSKVKGALPCGAGTKFFAVSPSGDLFPCHTMYSDDKHKIIQSSEYYFKVGNVVSGIDEEKLLGFLTESGKLLCSKCDSGACNYCLAVHFRLKGILPDLRSNSCRVFQIIDKYAVKFEQYLISSSSHDIEYYREIFNGFVLLKKSVLELTNNRLSDVASPTLYDLATLDLEGVNNNIASAVLDILSIVQTALVKKEEKLNV